MPNGLETVFINEAMEGFSTILAPLAAFSWAAKAENATLGDTVKVPYISNVSASGVFNNITGYTGVGNVVTSKDVKLGQLLYQKMDVDDATMSKLGPDAMFRIAQAMGRDLARDVISASLAATVTDANFPTSASITSNQLTSSLGLATLTVQADNLNWSTQRGMILAPSAMSYLMQNGDVNVAFNYGSNDPVQKGIVPSVYGFTANKYTGAMPKADLKGIICDPSAIIIGMGVHAPGPESAGLVKVERAELNGLVMQLKRWYSPDHAVSRFVIECLFGCTVGNATGLVQLK